MKKKLFLCCFSIACAIGIYIAIDSTAKIEKNDILIENAEALANPETETSWSCVGMNKKCEAECGVCGTKIKSEGTITGTHRCAY